MTTAPNHNHSIAWLDSKSRWFRNRAELTRANINDLTGVMHKMVFVAPVGDRVHHSIQLFVKNLRSLEKELNYMAIVSGREARRLESVDGRIARIFSVKGLVQVSGAIDPLAAELAEYEANQAAWEERCFPPEPVPEEPDTDVVADADDLPLTPITLPAETATGAPLVVSAGPATKDRRVMDIASIRLAADHIAGVSRGMQDHQSAVLRALTDIPTDISVRMQRRLKRSRQACAGGFERQAPRLLRQSMLLNTRIRTAGLFDGVFNPDIDPIAGTPTAWQPPMQDKVYRPPLAEHTATVETMAQELNVEMEVLLRVVKAIFGTDVVEPLPGNDPGVAIDPGGGSGSTGDPVSTDGSSSTVGPPPPTFAFGSSGGTFGRAIRMIGRETRSWMAA